MAKLPTYTSERELSTQAAGVQRSEDFATQRGKDIQKLGQTASKLAEMWQDAKNTESLLASQNIMDRTTNEVLNRYKMDKTYTEQEAFDTIEKAREETMGLWSDNLARQRWEIHANRQSNMAVTRIQGMTRQRTLDNIGANAILQADSYLQAYLQGQEVLVDGQWMEPKAATLKLYEGLAQQGVISETSLAKQFLKLQQWPVQKARLAIQTDPVQFLKDIESGQYEDIPAEDRASLVSSAKKAIVKQSRDRAYELEDRLFAGELTYQDIEQANVPLEEGGIGAKRAAKLKRDLEKYYQNIFEGPDMLRMREQDQVMAENYANTVATLVADDQTRFGAYELLANAIGDGVIDNLEAKQLATIYNRLHQEQEKPERGSWKASLNALFGWHNQNPSSPAKVASDIKTFVDVSLAGGDPSEISEQVLRNRYNQMYPTAPLGPNENPSDPNRPRDITYQKVKTGFFGNIAKGVTTGFVSAVEGGASGLSLGAQQLEGFDYMHPILKYKVDDKTVGEHIRAAVANRADQISERLGAFTQELTPDDPGWTFLIASGAGSAASFFVPGFGIMKGLEAANFASRVALWTGLSVSAVLESAVEGGFSYKQAVQSGLPNDQAVDIGSAVFWVNVPSTVVLNRFGVFGDIGPWYRRMITSGFFEGSQEVTQQIYSNIAANDPLFAGVFESAVVGAVIGGGTSVLTQPAIEDMDALQEQWEWWDDFRQKLGSEAGFVRIGPGEILPEGEGGGERVPLRRRRETFQGIREDLARMQEERAAKQMGQEELIQEAAALEDIYAEFEQMQRSYEDIDAVRLAEITGESVEEAQAYLSDISNTTAEIRAELEAVREEARGFRAEIRDMTRNIKALQQRLTDYRRGMKKGRTLTRQEIAANQTRLIEIIESSALLTKEDRGQFLRTVKNAQTEAQFAVAALNVWQRARGIYESRVKTQAMAAIQKELKTTKPVKQGRRRVGRYGYEDNKLFQDLRELMKLKQADAAVMLFNMPNEGLSKTDIIRRRVLSLVANGKGASAALHERVLADIQELKMAAEGAKDEADFFEKYARASQAQELTNRLNAPEEQAKLPFRTQVANLYRQGFTNIGSMLNTMFGKKISDALDPQLEESARNTAVSLKTDQMLTKSAEIYNVSKGDFVAKVLMPGSEKAFRLTNSKGETQLISRNQLVDIYNALKNDLIRERYYNEFGGEQIQGLMANLTEQDVAFADYLQEEVQSYVDVLNDRHVEIYGMDMGFVDNYWPSTSERVNDFFEDIRMQSSEIPGSIQARSVSARVVPIPADAWLKAAKHVAESEHVQHVSRKYEELRRLFDDSSVKRQITNKYGASVYKTLSQQINELSLGKQIQELDAVTDMMGTAINYWVIAKIGLNPAVFVKQLISVGNYMEVMPVGEWNKGFIKGASSPKATFDYMWNNSPFLQARFQRGYSEALQEALKGAQSITNKWGKWQSALTSLVRAGDIGAIIYGGYPYVKYLESQGMSTEEAFKKFELATLQAQQSGLASSRSQFQNSNNPLARLFLAFKNTANQYFRKMVDAQFSYINGDMTKTEYAKTMAIYAVIQPVLFAGAGELVREGLKSIGDHITGEDDEEYTMENLQAAIMEQLIANPAQAIPIFDDLARSWARKATDQTVWKTFNTPVLDQLEAANRALQKKQVTGEDYFNAVGTVLELSTGTPVLTYKRMYDYILGKRDKSKKRKKTWLRKQGAKRTTRPFVRRRNQ